MMFILMVGIVWRLIINDYSNSQNFPWLQSFYFIISHKVAKDERVCNCDNHQGWNKKELEDYDERRGWERK